MPGFLGDDWFWTLASGGPPPGPVPSLLWFKVKEAAGAATIVDAVAGATATLAGGVAVVTDGTRGTALSFPGGVGQTTTYFGGFPAPLTLAAWVRPATADGTYRTVFGWSAAGGLTLRLNPSSQVELLSGGTALIGTSTTTITMDGATWSRVVATYDAPGNWKIFINNVAAGSGANLQALGGATLTLGTEGGHFWIGRMSNALIDGRVWSAGDVAADFAGS